ncbi:MAG: pyruvate kinase [Alphaproteobacteria bacterium]
MRRYRKAKIVATIGPASNDAKTLRAMFEAGADVFRLNFSHGSHADHRRRYDLLRALERDTGRPIGILQDLQGPKIRVGKIAGGKVEIKTGQHFRLDTGSEPGDAKRAPLPHPEIFAALARGDHVLIDDGRLRLEVLEIGADFAECTVLAGGMLSDRKGVNLPGAKIDISALTDKDRKDLAYGLELGVDWVALSFVQRPDDILEIRKLVQGRAGIVAKIEKPAALESIDGIIALADAIMVARGDLGVEIPPEEVPGRQKELVRACRLAGKPVIVATQMLETMITSPQPTRAEASDVATAVYDGADAVMLSAETAAGDFPVESVAMMSRIIRSTEEHKSYRAIIEALKPEVENTIPHAIASAAARVASMVQATAIVSFTSSGTTAARVARSRPDEPIISMTPNLGVARKLALLWGAHTVHHADILSFHEMVETAETVAREQGFAETGDRIVVTAGVPFGASGTTNILQVATLKR